MNPIINQYIDTIEARLVERPVITSYQILKKEIAPSEGKLRLKLILSDGGAVELFEYISVVDKKIKLLKYSFHWQNSEGKIIFRWDNAPHHQELRSSPHHVHLKNGTVQEVMKVPNILFVIEKIESFLNK